MEKFWLNGFWGIAAFVVCPNKSPSRNDSHRNFSDHYGRNHHKIEMLKKVREFLGIAQPYFAGLLGVSLAQYRMAETDRRKIDFEAQRRLFDFDTFLFSREPGEPQLPSPLEMDATWRNRHLRTLKAQLNVLELEIEDYNEKYQKALNCLEFCQWLKQNPELLPGQRQQKALELIEYNAQKTLSAPKLIPYWEMRLKRNAIQAKLDLLRMQDPISG